MIPKINKEEYQMRLGVLFLAMIAPILCILLQGLKPSLSQYWETEMQPLFIIANATTSYYLFSIKNWRLSALLLLLLTSFSIEIHPGLHNYLAIIFFLVTLYPLWVTNHYKWVFWIYLSSLILLPFSMLGAEIIAIWSMGLHQGMVLRKLYKLKQNKEDGDV